MEGQLGPSFSVELLEHSLAVVAMGIAPVQTPGEFRQPGHLLLTERRKHQLASQGHRRGGLPRLSSWFSPGLRKDPRVQIPPLGVRAACRRFDPYTKKHLPG